MPAAALHSPIEIHALTPDRLDDFLAFFEGPAFADNPKWGFCFCQFLYVDHDKVHWPERSAQENRAAACERICSGRMQGYLAYREGQVVGWCNAAPRTMMAAFADEVDSNFESIGQIGCFVVAKAHRRSGVASALLRAACAGLAAQDLKIAEATPIASAASDAQHHFGPAAMFLAAGFTPHRTDEEGNVVLRLLLQP
jgi:GNAT superfamily N-acetyltransferase